MASDLVETKAQLRQERDQARQIVRDIHWMARRYADGRRSYAVGMFNDAVRPAFDAGWVKWTNDEPRYARDGGFDAEYKSIDQRLTDAEAEIATLRTQLAEQARMGSEREAGLRAALRESVTAIDDWLHSYAPELCGQDHVDESTNRIGQLGTLGYIAHIQDRNRRALASTPDAGGRDG